MKPFRPDPRRGLSGGHHPSTNCPFAVNDGAYILGALAPRERAEYERHLAACPPCRESVTQLAVLPGLLGRLDPATVDAPIAAPPEILPRVIATARWQRRVQRRRHLLTTAAACVAVAALAAAVGIGMQLYRAPLAVSPPVASITGAGIEYSPMSASPGYNPVVAEMGIRAEASGTVVVVRCRYHGDDSGSWPIWLVVYPRDEEAEEIGSWVARAGQTVNYSAVTRYTPAQIDHFELHGANDTTIAWWRPS
jgi:hypothetical protein